MWKKTCWETYHENTETRHFALGLKQKLVVGIISNVSTLSADYNAEKGAYEGFDSIILSAKTGMMKPNRDIFQEANRLTRTKPEKCVLIDDKQPIVEKAREYGFHRIVYENARQLQEELTKITQIKDK